MAATFTPVTIENFFSIFKPEKGWQMEQKSNEITLVRDFPSFEKISPFWGKNIKIVVYTGISASKQKSRNCGKDAIRFTVIKSFVNKEGKQVEYAFVSKQPKVYRSTVSRDAMEIIERCKKAVEGLMETVRLEIMAKLSKYQ